MGTRIVNVLVLPSGSDVAAAAAVPSATRALNGYETWIVDLPVSKGETNEGARSVSALRVSAVCCTLCARRARNRSVTRCQTICFNVQVDR